jgi:hypothetical protein
VIYQFLQNKLFSSAKNFALDGGGTNRLMAEE